VADEPQVPAWQNTPPQDPAAIKALEDEYFRTNGDIRAMLRVLFNSEFFKNARFAKVKSPAEVVASTMKLSGEYSTPRPGFNAIAMSIRYMGQDLMNPPTVEGWHTGREWIDSGTLVERINFAADHLGNPDHPGVKAMVQRMAARGKTLTANQMLDGCLELLGGYELPEETRSQILSHVEKDGAISTGAANFGHRVAQTLQLIAATQEYQFA
jgi:hypothetical protein